MSNVANALAHKVKPMISIAPQASVLEALRLMADNNVGSVVVKTEQKYYGIFTERDYSRNVILKNRHSSQTKVEEVMSSDLPSVSSIDSLDHCMALMSTHNIRYLPVMEDHVFAGIISITDVIREKVLQQKEMIGHLQNYIHG